MSPREGVSLGDSVDITKKPYAIEKYAHLLHTLSVNAPDSDVCVRFRHRLAFHGLIG